MTAAATRIDIRVAGLPPIAAWTQGRGPAIVLVHGSMCDHRVFDALAAELVSDFTLFAVDRRGFGASGDAPGYAAEREFADVAAVVGEVVARTGGPVTLFGHSWGASCALGCAARARNVSRLVLYEPSFGLRYPPGFIEDIEARVAKGDAEGAILAVLTDLAGMSEEEAARLRAGPTWSERLATAPTIAREARIEGGWEFRPGQFAAITAPTLFLVGSQSPPELVEISERLARDIAGSVTERVAGPGHFGYRTHPDLIAGAIRRFAALRGP